MATGARQVSRFYLNVVPAGFPNCLRDELLTLDIGNDQWSRPDGIDSRTKPVPLWRYPTDRGPFYEYRIRYPVMKYIGKFVCGGNTLHTLNYDSMSFYAQTSMSDYFPWSNILAGKIKQLRCNLASDIAEYRESLDVAVSLAEKLTAAVRTTAGIAKRCGGNPRCIARALGVKAASSFKQRERMSWGDIPAAWLTGALALGPTIASLDTVLTAISAKDRARPILRVIRFSQSNESKDGYIYDMYGRRPEGVWHGSLKTRVVAVVELLPPKGVFDDNFTPGNPLEIGWEMIPLSFVVDWFIPIGNWLSALDAYSGVSSVVGSVSTRTRVAVTGVKSPGDNVLTAGTMLYSRFERRAFSSPPPLTIPQWSPHPSVKKLVTALSLLATSINHPGR